LAIFAFWLVASGKSLCNGEQTISWHQMNIYLIRHTLPDVLPGICYGHADLGLASTFAAELQNLQSKLAHLTNPVLISSPLRRCSILAESLAQHFDIPVVNKDVRLMELNFGDWELKRWVDIPQGVVSEWSDAHIKQAPPNGESYVELHARAKQFLEELTVSKQHEHVLVFTHAGVIRALVAEISKVPLTAAANIEVNYGSVTHVVVENGVTRIERVND
jgi:alpha-ribazole phosphatase